MNIKMNHSFRIKIINNKGIIIIINFNKNLKIIITMKKRK